MPAVTSTSEEQNEEDGETKMWSALKRYIIRERQRKKEEYEAEVEEERLRKEREARERQDVMTLEETKEQIEQLEQKLKQLEKEKQQLFMQLKKLLNKDEIRKRQQQKESNEMQPIKMPMGNLQMPLFSMPPSGQGEPPPNQRPPPLTTHILNKQPGGRGGGPGAGVKRARSPSPTYALYAHRVHAPPPKHQPVYSDHKLEDGRMGRQMARAVLWNKPPQYASNAGSSVSSGAYYAMPTSGVVSVVGERPPPLHYAHHAHTPHTPHTPHHGGLLYTPVAAQPQLYLDMLKNNHQEQKKDKQPQVLIGLSEAHHPAVSGGYTPSRHLALHAHSAHNAHSAHGAHNAHNPHNAHNMQNTKSGSITQGYPVQQSNQQNSSMYPNRHRY